MNIDNPLCNSNKDGSISKKLIKFGYLKYEYYDISDNKNILIKTEYLPGLVDLQNVKLTEKYKIIISGFITFTKDDTYYFNCNADDTCLLSLNNNIIINQNKYVGNKLTESTGIFMTSGTYTWKIEHINYGGDQNLIIRIKTTDSSEWLKIPPSWYSTEFIVNLSDSYNNSFNTYCSNNWKSDINCVSAIKDDKTNTLLNMYVTDIIAECSNKDKNDFNNSNACKQLYTIDSNSNKIQKSFCQVNNNFLDESKCITVLDAPIVRSLFDNYCVTNNIYNINSDYTKCNNYYSSLIGENSDYYNNAINNYCIDDNNLFSEICNINEKIPKVGDIIKDAKIKYCKNSDNINNNNCKPLVLNNLDIYGESLVEHCEKNNYQNFNDFLCKSVYTNTMNPTNPYIKKSKIKYCKQDNNINNLSCLDYAANPANITNFDNYIISRCEKTDGSLTDETICKYIYNSNNPTINSNKNISLSKDRIYRELCKKNYRFINDIDCYKYSLDDKNQNDFIDPYIDYCSKNGNIVTPKCKNFYNTNINKITNSCTNISEIEQKKESFHNNKNYYYYFMLFIIIILFICNIIYGKNNYIYKKVDNLYVL